MRDMVMQEVNDEGGSFDWDEPLSETYVLKWKSFFCELYELQSLTFSRCLCPSGVVGKPVLVMFSDGSKNAYGTCAYIRWELECGKYECRLLIAKNRIAPKRQLSVPRLELCGAVLSSRLRTVIEQELDFDFDFVIHIVDSAIVRAQIQKESYGFGTFVATRVAEIQSMTDPNEWW